MSAGAAVWGHNVEMTDDFAQIVASFREYEAPRKWNATDPFRLACTISGPACKHEVEDAWKGVALPPVARDLWRVTAEARLFEDVDYGQWGLVLLPPAAARERTDASIQGRSEDFESSDVVIGEFLGDSDLLVLTEDGEVLVALPLYGRSDWFRPATTLGQFLDRFRETRGEKYWE